MAKKGKKKNLKAEPVQKQPSSMKWQIPAFLKNETWVSVLLAVIAFAVYANTLNHGYTLDDDIVIKQNEFTQQGLQGISGILENDTFYGFFKERGKATLVSGGRYRPFTLVLFAILYELFGDAPMVFHLFVIAAFALCVFVLYRVVLRLLDPEKKSNVAYLVAFLATLLFAVHPVHVEVVANIKGCDETFALLGSLIGLWGLLLAFDKQKYSFALLGTVAYLAALFSKENAFLWIALSPLALLFFRTKKIGEIAKLSAPLWAAGAFFFIVRGQILNWSFGDKPNDLMNNPFLKVENGFWVDFSFTEWLGTISHCLGQYILLLFAPITLTHDYYPRHIDIHTLASPSSLISLLLYIGLMYFAFAAKNKLIRYGIIIYLFTLLIVSNLLFPVGTNMGERFIFMPSVGFCLVVASFLVDYFKNKPTMNNSWRYPVYIIGAFSFLFLAKTMMRNGAWKDNETLFFADAETSIKSAKLQHACGGITLDKALAITDVSSPKRQTLLNKALKHLDRANTIHPTYKDARLNRGNAHFHMGNFDAAIADFREVKRIAPEFEKATQNLAVALRDGGKYYGEKKGDIHTAMKYLTEAQKLMPIESETMRLLGVANGNMGRHAEAISWFQKVVDLQPENASALFDLSIAFGASGNSAKAQALQQRAFQMDPKLLEKRAQK